MIDDVETDHHHAGAAEDHVRAGGSDDRSSPGTDLESTLCREAPDLLRYLRRHVHDDDAADVLSDVFVVAWRRIGDVPRPAQEARMWLFGVARRTAATHRRGVARRVRVVERLQAELAAGIEQAGADGASVAEDDRRVDAVRRALAQQRPADREILALVHWDGFSLTETAGILGVRPGAARTRYQRARQRIARTLQAQLS